MIQSLSENQFVPPRHAVYIKTTEGEIYGFKEDDVAEVLTLPGNLLQVVNMDGERSDPTEGRIVFASGDWKVWVRQGDSTVPYENVEHVQQNGEDGLVTSQDRKTVVGSQIRRVKRTSLLDK